MVPFPQMRKNGGGLGWGESEVKSFSAGDELVKFEIRPLCCFAEERCRTC